MKLCLICGKTSPEQTPTCPNCGHGSWGAAAVERAEPEPERSLPVAEFDPAPEPPVQPERYVKRGRGRPRKNR